MIITYANIDFNSRYIDVVNWNESPQFDSSGMDYLYTKFNISFQTVLNAKTVTSAQALLGGVPFNSPPAIVWKALRDILLKPRQKFVAKDDQGNLFLTAPAGNNVADDNGGPKVIHAEISPFGTSYILDFEIEVCLTLCTGTTPGILSNRWSTKSSYDQNAMCTHTIDGIAIISPSTNLNPDLFRQAVTPPLMKGFVREGFEYTVANDGLSISYSFQDREEYIVPPKLGTSEFTATQASGTYNESTGDGVTTFAEIEIHLEGPKDADKAKLLQQAALIAKSYITDKNGKINPGWLRGAAFSTPLYKNAVDVRARIQLLGDSTPTLFGVGYSKILQRPAGSDTGEAYVPNVRGTELAMVVHSKLAPPCTSTVDKAGYIIATPENPGKDNKPYKAPVISTPSIDTTPSKYTPPHTENPYDNYHIESMYVDKGSKFCFPVAGRGNPQILDGGGTAWFRIVRWNALRSGAKPMAPQAMTGDSNEELFAQEIRPEAPRLAMSGLTYDYGISGVYVYALRIPPTEYKSGTLPYAVPASGNGVTKYQTGDFSTGLI